MRLRGRQRWFLPNAALHLVRRECVLIATSPTRAKRPPSTGVSGSAGGSEEKWAQAAMEFIYEANQTADAGRRAGDVRRERQLSTAFDRYMKANEVVLERRMGRLAARMGECLELLTKLRMPETLEEATMLNSEQPPLHFRRPTLTPPLVGYAPGFGMDVPQLKAQQMEYPAVRRETDELEYGAGGGGHFPFVEVHDIADLVQKSTHALTTQAGEIRQAAPTTGVEGESFAAHVALEAKALARQKLLLDLAMNASFRDEYERDEAFRLAELERRGLRRLGVDDARPRHEIRHFAHEPAYQPFREE